MIEDNLEDDPVEEFFEVTDAPPKVFFEPMLLAAPVENVLVDDTQVPIEDTPAVWSEFLELEIPVPVIELVRLVRVPTLLCMHRPILALIVVVGTSWSSGHA